MDLDSLKESIKRARKYHTQLIMVHGESASLFLEHAAASENLPAMNLSLELSERLIEIPKQERPKSAASVFAELISEQQARVLLLDHIEILFDRSLSIDPLKLLQNNAKNMTLVVVWPGERSASSLAYAMPSHPEYRSYKASELGEMIFVDADWDNEKVTWNTVI